MSFWARMAAKRWRAPIRNGAWRCRRMKSTIWCGIRQVGKGSDRCGIDDVRAGELRTLPPQDIQRRVLHRRRTDAFVAVRHDTRDLCAQFLRRAVRLPRQRGRHRRRERHPILRGSLHAALRGHGRTDRHFDEGGDPQSSHGDLAVSRRGHRRGRRDPRRRCDRHRREAQGRVDRFLGLESQNSRHDAALGGRFWQAGPDCLRARHHDCGAHRRSRLQQ